VSVRSLQEGEIRSIIGPALALEEVRGAFVALDEGRVVLPDVLHLDFADVHGEAHVKGAWIQGTPYWSIKAATGFYGNPLQGLPVAGGVSLVFSAETGFLELLLFDNGYLTELRTGSAGALAADLLARSHIEHAAIIGAGGQARYQLEALLLVRRPAQIVVHSRRAEAARAYADEMGERLGVEVLVEDSLQAAVEGSDLIVTTTPAREPIIRAEWVEPGTHITAMGSDLPEKQELDPDLLAKADLVVADLRRQALRQGEVHHAVRVGALREEDIVELGAVAARRHSGRTNDQQITIVDLTGLGVQDAAMAAAVAEHCAAGDTSASAAG
jgi:ornithine cyclodeaminase/alanine dehydrogenase-like protein (mu-crystallin family)